MKGPTVLGEFNSAIIAALGALVVGVLMKFVSKLTDKRKDTEWREKYYHQLEVTTLLQAELAALRLELSEYTNSGEFSSNEAKDD